MPVPFRKIAKKRGLRRVLFPFTAFLLLIGVTAFATIGL